MRLLAIEYRAHAGQIRSAFVALPRWYRRGSRRALPLVISPHGRGIDARENCVSWGDLPAVGGFAVVCPVGQGRRLRRYSWGAPTQIDDLRRMPEIVSRDVPWLHVDRSRIYAVGGSMGGQETLLLVARAPRLLAGAIAFDAVTNLGAQYRSLPSLRCDRLCYELNGGSLGTKLQRLERIEVGGTPTGDPRAYAARSPLHYARRIADSGVPVELWWSTSDLIVRHQATEQSGALFAAIQADNPRAPVEAFVGSWQHSHEERPDERLPFALAQMGLLPRSYLRRSARLHERHFIPRRLLDRTPTRWRAIELLASHDRRRRPRIS